MTGRSAELEARRLAAIVSGSRDAILSGTVDGVIESWNAGAERLHGYTADSDRPYRAAQARTELADNAGSQFDPHVVAALLDAMR